MEDIQPRKSVTRYFKLTFGRTERTFGQPEHNQPELLKEMKSRVYQQSTFDQTDGPDC